MSTSASSGFSTPRRRNMTGDDSTSTSLMISRDGTNSPKSNYHRQEEEPPKNFDLFEDDYEDESDDDDDDDDDEEDVTFSVPELLYGMSSYHAIALPVSVTMILAASAACFINTPQTIQDTAKEFAVYQVWKLDNNNNNNNNSGSSGNSNSINFLRSVGNTFVMVSVIGCMTFGIVLLYKYRCMKCLIGYMVLSSAMLLGFMGGVMSELFLSIYHIPVDVITYYLVHYNFAIVGVLSIFFAKEVGVPAYITQMYLICSSVILAWHFSHFDEWTAWTLLVMLALYDLCAVLTPCGPLKALVNLMQQDDAPEMPGLLYDAKLDVKRPHSNNNRNESHMAHATANSETIPVSRTTSSMSESAATQHSSFTATSTPTVEMTPSRDIQHQQPQQQPSSFILPNQQSEAQPEMRPKPIRIVSIPLAIAILYKLNISASTLPKSKTTKKQKRMGRSRNREPSSDRAASNSPLLASTTEQEEDQWKSFEDYSRQTFSQYHLAHHAVTVQLPHGNIVRVPHTSRPLYQIISASGQVRRIIQVDRRTGKCYQVVQNEDGEYESDDEDDEENGNSIRLGLGDFIFYSVLVAKAALYSFTTFAACMLVILAGLGGTLVLLSVYHSALPALPISIFLGVLFYGLTRFAIEPWIQSLLQAPLYV